MTKINLKNVVWKEGEAYVSLNLNTGVSSFGDTRKEALQMLKEAVQLHLEDEPISSIQKIERASLEPLVIKHA